METPGSMYENSKKFLKGALEKQIDNALYVAESAVDRFLPEDAEMKEGSPAPENHDMDTSVMRFLFSFFLFFFFFFFKKKQTIF